MNERIVMAAAKSPSGHVIPSIRHGDEIFFRIADEIFDPEVENYHLWTQGFLTNKKRFVEREEAWTIALAANQIIRDQDKCVGTLYSEHLY
ncbi:hypothetical protein SHAb15599_00046 [Acinetobacter phage SH-Ab 15599]|nr:hypothetical protein SHAb15599_00046 [Acinetobacter phage SH-Ab 15599]